MNEPNESQEQSRETNAEAEAGTRVGDADRSDAGAGAEGDVDAEGGDESDGLGDHAANNRRQVVEGHGGELLTERLDEFGSIETVIEETKLTENQAEILWGLGHNKSARQVADEMDTTWESVRTVRHQALEEKFDRLIEDVPKIENTLGLLEPLVMSRGERNPKDDRGRKREGDSEPNASRQRG